MRISQEILDNLIATADDINSLVQHKFHNIKTNRSIFDYYDDHFERKHTWDISYHWQI